MLGINGWELLVLILLAIIVIGPERMPEYGQLRDWVRTLRDVVTQNKDKIKTEMGGDEVDWKQYDPRQYDPRRIVREALYEPATPAQQPPRRPDAAPSAPRAGAQPAPFDTDAT